MESAVRSVAATLIVFLACLPAWAAPLQADEAASAPDSSTRISSSRDTGTAAGSSTVDMLIDMQSRGPGLSFNDRPRRVERPTRPANGLTTTSLTGARPEHAADADRAGAAMFGAGADPAANQPRNISNSEAAVNARIRNSVAKNGAEGAPRESAGAEGGLRLYVVPRAVIEFVRNNRNWIIAGSLALLVLLWGGHMVLARHLRH